MNLNAEQDVRLGCQWICSICFGSAWMLSSSVARFTVNPDKTTVLMHLRLMQNTMIRPLATHWHILINLSSLAPPNVLCPRTPSCSPMVSQDEAFSHALNDKYYWLGRGYWTAMYHVYVSVNEIYQKRTFLPQKMTKQTRTTRARDIQVAKEKNLKTRMRTLFQLIIPTQR